MNPSRRLVCFVFCALAVAATGAAGASAAAAPPRVMATIKPLHSLVAAVMRGIGEPPFLLIDGAISPHDFKLRVSDRARLESADVLLRVSSSLESRLHPRALPEKMQVWTLAEELPADVLLARREDLFEDHDHGHGDDHGDDHSDHDDHDDHESERAAIDSHFWLSPRVASIIVSLLARKLSQIDPENAARYRQNAAATTRKIAALTTDIRGRFSRRAAASVSGVSRRLAVFRARFRLARGGRDCSRSALADRRRTRFALVAGGARGRGGVHCDRAAIRIAPLDFSRRRGGRRHQNRHRRSARRRRNPRRRRLFRDSARRRPRFFGLRGRKLI